MHLVDHAAGFLGATPIVASTIPIAVGAALGSVMQREDRITVAYFGEAATEEGTFHEAVNFAALKRLPVLFVCENNLYSVYSPLSVRQPDNRQVWELAKGHGIDTHHGDGNDVLEVFEIAAKAIHHVRRGMGPSFVEFSTYRWREHCGPNYDNSIGYRPEDEFLEWKEKCPLERFRNFLLAGGHADQAALDRISDKIRTEIQEAVAFAKESPFPEEAFLSQNIYAP
jgi:pyruvate dehydrogenase E1 component alpha subunit